ncbi:MAG: TPM domain-containing protein [Methylococcales bacterium]|nr:TPM domain-containing protein [Methylococcaceae bacterium]
MLNLSRVLLAAMLLVCAVAWGATLESIPNQRLVNGSHVANPDGIIGADATSEIDQLLINVEKKTGAQVAVVAVESIGQSDIFTFAQHLFERWGIGNKARDDGLLVLLVKDQHAIRLHTGYGLEGTLPDVICKRIEHDYMVPAFTTGRYDDGLLAGLNAVAKLLSDPAYAQSLKPAENPEISTSWEIFKYVVAITGVIIILITFGIKSLNGYFLSTSDGGRNTPKAMRWTRKQWLMLYAAIPALIVAGYDQLPIISPILMCSVTLYGYFILTMIIQAWRQQQTINVLFKKNRCNKYAVINELITSQQSFWGWMALLFPLPFLVYYFYYLSRKSYYRNHPRNCPKCQASMRKLSEQEEDKFLSQAQQMEETLHSVDHDVWQCNACEATTSWGYSGTETKYEKCPKCKSLAYVEESGRTLVSPTYSTRGKGETIHACQFCGHRKTSTYSISMLRDNSSSDSSSSSSSASSSSSSSGDNWGGGNSGGGGASSNW